MTSHNLRATLPQPTPAEQTRSAVAAKTSVRHPTVVFVSFLEPWSVKEGSGAPSFYETLAGYAQHGWAVHYLTCYKRLLGFGSHERDIDVAVDGMTTHRFRLPAPLKGFPKLQARFDRLAFPVCAAFQLRKLLARQRIDVLYGYEVAGILAIRTLRVLSHRRLPVVSRYQGTLFGFNPSVGHMIRKIDSMLGFSARSDAYIMTNDGTGGDVILKRWNRRIGDHNLLFIRNGIDKSLFLRALRREEVLREFGLDPARFHLLSVSRLKYWKRVERSIEILAALCRSDVDLIIVGDGDERARLERIARNHGVSERVYFLGAIERAQVAALMNVADIFLSLYDASNCGNPLFEALLCGRCIVTLDNGGTGEVIKDGWNGRLVSMGELHRLPAIVDQLIADSPARERLQQGAREWARREMRTWDERIAYEIDWLSSRLGLANST